MNKYHYILIGFAVLGFLLNLYKHGETKPVDMQKYNAKTSFWATTITITLIILSSL